MRFTVTTQGVVKISTFKPLEHGESNMSMELDAECPDCGEQTFYRAASTTLHLGEKVKWHCPGCDYGFVKINGIDSSAV